MKVLRGSGMNLAVVTSFTFDLEKFPRNKWNTVVLTTSYSPEKYSQLIKQFYKAASTK